MLLRSPAVLLLPLFLSAAAVAQTSGGWSAKAGASTSSLHSGASGGKHEHVEVTNSVRPNQSSDEVTLTIVYFDTNEQGQVVEKTSTVKIPVGGKTSFHGDVKSVVVTAGAADAEGSYSVTYP